MRSLGFALVFLVPASTVAQEEPQPPTVAQVQQWFESGQYEQVVQAVPSDDPKAVYLVGASFERMQRTGEAREVYQQLAGRDEADPWGQIGRSAVALLDAASDGAQAMPAEDGAEVVDPATAAEQAARQAIGSAGRAAPASNMTGPDSTLAMAHYQLGLVLVTRGDAAQAADEFSRAVAADPAFAYAHYYAGLMYSRINRAAQTANAWEAFLKLAPKAPEAPQVLSIMRTLRGR